MPLIKKKTGETKKKNPPELIYVKNISEGITRRRNGKGFIYTDERDKPIHDKNILDRIKKLVIPPAWENVWICPYPEGHLQATGTDKMGRKQYLYHPEWTRIRNETKFNRMLQFAAVLPKLRKRVEADLRKRNTCKEKVLAAAVDLMQKAYIRTGNDFYRKLHGSYGLTTLRDKHVKIRNENLRFSFTGKKGVKHDIELRDKRLARIIKQCRDIPGYELFQYYDEDGNKNVVDSGDINHYIKEAAGADFFAKDIRTWAGSLLAFIECKKTMEENGDEMPAYLKRNTAQIVKSVSRQLGNTPSVCRKYYIHPRILEAYENGELEKLIKSWPKGKAKTDERSACEKMMLRILKS